jgi:hypothetical protein
MKASRSVNAGMIVADRGLFLAVAAGVRVAIGVVLVRVDLADRGAISVGLEEGRVDLIRIVVVPGGGGGFRGPKPGGGGGRPQERRDDYRDRPQRPPEQPRQVVVRAEMLPEPAGAAGISKQIKSSGRACGVFRVAKLFLERPERYRVRVTALDPNATMHQIGDGPVSFDRATVERGAFRANLDKFYSVETVQTEAPKGNYTAVARHRFSGVLLGPPNHHGYQVAIRKLYEERFSRRMSFPDFQREIENVTDPAIVEQWKQQASSTTVYKTKVEEGQEPVTFATVADAEQHFRTTHLPKLVKSAHIAGDGGGAAMVPLDRNITFTVRDLIERERRVPVGLVNALRPYFSEAGLHLFKWKRKILFASAIRPQRHPAEQTFGEGISAILNAVSEKPGIKRPELAQKISWQSTARRPGEREAQGSARRRSALLGSHRIRGGVPKRRARIAAAEEGSSRASSGRPQARCGCRNGRTSRRLGGAAGEETGGEAKRATSAEFTSF